MTALLSKGTANNLELEKAATAVSYRKGKKRR